MSDPGKGFVHITESDEVARGDSGVGVQSLTELR